MRAAFLVSGALIALLSCSSKTEKVPVSSGGSGGVAGAATGGTGGAAGTATGGAAGAATGGIGGMGGAGTGGAAGNVGDGGDFNPKCVNPTNYPKVTCCYVDGATTVSWDKARGECQKAGADLVQVVDANMDAAITGAVANKNIWIGLSDTASEATFIWVDGSGVTYENWANLEPNSKPANPNQNQNCVAKAVNGKWFDHQCDGVALPTVRAWCCGG